MYSCQTHFDFINLGSEVHYFRVIAISIVIKWSWSPFTMCQIFQFKDVEKNAISCGLPKEYCENESNTCIQFCCPPEHFVSPTTKECVPYQNTDKQLTTWKPEGLEISPFHEMNPSCKNQVELDGQEPDKDILEVFKNGSLKWSKYFVSNNSISMKIAFLKMFGLEILDISKK